MGHVDLYFQVVGTSLPLDHAFHLYSAICKATGIGTSADSWFHAATNVGLIPVRGTPGPNHLLILDRNARFGLRIPPDEIPRALTLAGRRLLVSGTTLLAGTTSVEALKPSPVLYARIVTTRNGEDPDRFDAEVAKQLAALEVRGSVVRGNRRVVRIHHKKVIGHELLVSELSPDESIRLQEEGLGGRRKMGCGVFFPRRERNG